MDERQPLLSNLALRSGRAADGFSRLLLAVSRAAIATCAVGCSNELDGERSGEAVECGPLGTAQLDAPLHTARPTTFAAVFEQYLTVEGDRLPNGPAAYVRVQYGESCADATNLASCEAEYMAARSSPGCSAEPCPRFAVVRRENSFERITDRSLLVELLGSIDTTSEAILLAAFEGHPVTCEQGSGRHAEGTRVIDVDLFYSVETRWEDCGTGVYDVFMTVGADGQVRERENRKVRESTCTIGRLPLGLSDAAAPRSRSAIGAFLANAAHLEAASVHAFRQIARELIALRAPAELLDATLDALADELMHARQVAHLARQFGAEVVLPQVADTRERTAFQLALDNAQEGCVRETYGALVATYQAETARHAGVRRTMQQIAEDETRHAQLSWRLAAWLDGQLDDEQRGAVERMRASALSRLQAELDPGLSDDECAEIGFPTRAVAERLLRSLSPSIG